MKKNDICVILLVQSEHFYSALLLDGQEDD